MADTVSSRWGQVARERGTIADAVRALRSGEVMTVSADLAPLIADLLTTFLAPNLRAGRVRGWSEAVRVAERILGGVS